MEFTRIEDIVKPIGSGLKRGKGLHLTDVIQDYYNALFKPKPMNADLSWAMEMGFLWEDMLTTVLKQRAGVRPMEIVLDGIIGSPDGIDFCRDGTPWLVENKLTFASEKNNNPEINDKWRMQVMGYLKMLQRFILEIRCCRYDIAYILRMPPFVKTVRYICKFEQYEIDDNWLILTQHAQAAGLYEKFAENKEDIDG